jgi:hypothetical protein
MPSDDLDGFEECFAPIRDKPWTCLQFKQFYRAATARERERWIKAGKSQDGNILIGAIHLRREGESVIVSVEYAGRSFEVIREHYDSNFSHIVEALGIAAAIRGRE